MSSLKLYAQNLESRVSKAYYRQQTASFVDCLHPSLKYQSSSFEKNSYIKSKYLIKNELVEIVISPSMKAVLTIDSKVKLTGKVIKKYKNIVWNYSHLSTELIQSYKLKDLFCRVELHRELPVTISKNRLHINMHPHSLYDSDGFTKNTVQDYFHQDDFQHIVFLDNFDLTYNTLLKDFFKKQAIGYRIMNLSLPIVEVPKDIPIISASAGHAFYKIDVDDLEVIYTGGNLNYCILNNFRRLIDQFMQYSDGGVLDIKFDLSALMAQKGSWMSGARFPGSSNQSIIVKKAFEDSDFAKKFHKTYFDYMRDKHFPYYQRTPLYQTVVFNYKANDYTNDMTLKGSGTKKFVINLEYINE